MYHKYDFNPRLSFSDSKELLWNNIFGQKKVKLTLTYAATVTCLCLQVAPPESFGEIYDSIVSSPSKNYFMAILFTVIGIIFIVGISCGRVTKRVRAEVKNKWGDTETEMTSWCVSVIVYVCMCVGVHILTCRCICVWVIRRGTVWAWVQWTECHFAFLQAGLYEEWVAFTEQDSNRSTVEPQFQAPLQCNAKSILNHFDLREAYVFIIQLSTSVAVPAPATHVSLPTCSTISPVRRQFCWDSSVLCCGFVKSECQFLFFVFVGCIVLLCDGQCFFNQNFYDAVLGNTWSMPTAWEC